MSKKYTTEELIRSIKAEGRQIQGWFNKDEADAIIAKLRAADKLYEAARDMINVQPFIKDFPRFTADLRKAVADYGGKS